MKTNKQTIDKINETLEQIKPFLHADGGDIEFVDLTPEGIIQVKLLGNCSDCSMSLMTLKAGVEEAIKKAIPDIKGVVAINLTDLVP
ncbi:MAG: NifU family protein [Flavobacteriia bacterium]|nr:NifU family protein [Flavobacteriia bacterium]